MPTRTRKACSSGQPGDSFPGRNFGNVAENAGKGPACHPGEGDPPRGATRRSKWMCASSRHQPRPGGKHRERGVPFRPVLSPERDLHQGPAAGERKEDIPILMHIFCSATTRNSPRISMALTKKSGMLQPLQLAGKRPRIGEFHRKGVALEKGTVISAGSLPRK